MADHPTLHEVIAGLEKPFPPGAVRQRQGGGGAMLDYIDWPTAVRRLNDATGTNNWDFTVSDPQFIAGGDGGYAVCIGHLTIRFPDGTSATKGAAGGNAYGRGMNPDDAAKGAASDALKKCASLFGVALNLAEKGAPQGGYQQRQPSGQAQGRPYANDAPQQPAQQGGGGDLFCDECAEPLTETRFKDGTAWGPEQLATFGRRKHSQVLCMTHYREANNAKRRAEEALQTVPF
jgi:hypothetical protein